MTLGQSLAKGRGNRRYQWFDLIGVVQERALRDDGVELRPDIARDGQSLGVPAQRGSHLPGGPPRFGALGALCPGADLLFQFVLAFEDGA